MEDLDEFTADNIGGVDDRRESEASVLATMACDCFRVRATVNQTSARAFRSF